MVEALLLVLWVGTSLFFIVREIREKNNRESHEKWLLEIISVTHGIGYEFRQECIEALDSTRNIMGKLILDKYRKKIYALQQEYTNNLYEKISERIARRGYYSVKSIPEYLEREYERNISDIAYTFLHFCDVLSDYN